MVFQLFPEQKEAQNKTPGLWIMAGVLVLLLLILAFIWYGNQIPPVTGACTLDAKICPDGSAVGRVPPAC